jgi:hypothetical protein
MRDVTKTAVAEVKSRFFWDLTFDSPLASWGRNHRIVKEAGKGTVDSLSNTTVKLTPNPHPCSQS